ncbi:hypothetical protein BBK82_08265 [Lentzea guizhouensis]|uniref:Uncharacterized protein n=1 Tax=Lentzea guizhouensis TaxID=1586287 RepID=A0A1B2HY12_9PSEU|nr:hypothetical protein BBK82_08265 [Lentzea guizhouensis]
MIQAHTVAVGDVHHHHPPAVPERPVPRQLPAAPAAFVGRVDELAELASALEQEEGKVVISALAGTGGIGKTWLALHWAHTHVDRFPDGQLFVDLHGFSPAGVPVSAEMAVRWFLDALGVEPNRIPPELDAQAALYRSLVAGRRMLVMLDNAATAEQVVPLLPGSPTCTVLITGRTRLASLIDRHGCRHLTLGVLTRHEALALLVERLGARRVAAEADSVDELVALCGNYPLALAIIARTAATRPGVPLAELTGELRNLGLETLDHDTDPAASLPTVLSWSLRTLTADQRTMFSLLGIAPGPDTTLAAAVALTGLPRNRARKALSALEEASLLERRPRGRYTMHDLVRGYANVTAEELPTAEREAALTRAMEFYLHTALAADRLLAPHRPLPPIGSPCVPPLPLPDVEAAAAWLQDEHATLLATQRAAVAHRRHDIVWHLADALNAFHTRRGHLRDALATWQAAADATDHLADPLTRIRTYRALGHACARSGLHKQATENLNNALKLAEHHHEPAEQAHTHEALASAWEQRGDDQRALEHARRCLDLYRTLGRPRWEADALNLVGWHAARSGELETARQHCEAALALHRHHNDTYGEAATLDSLALVAHRAGDHRQAVDHYHHAIALLRSLGDAYEVAGILDRAGSSLFALGSKEKARADWSEALRLYQEQGRDTEADRVQRQLDDLDNNQARPKAENAE